MSNVLSFLERMGQDATLRHSADGQLELEMIRASLDPESRAAVIGKNQAALEALLKAEKNVCCMVYVDEGP